MNRFAQNLVAITILLAVIFWFRVPLREEYLNVREKVSPCSIPLSYSIGDFSDKFNISKEEFLYSIKKAEGIWEASLGKQLFVYKENGDIKISLIYDLRQETTDKLKGMGEKISNNKESYDSLKAEYDKLRLEYLREKDNIKTETEREAFNQKVGRLNTLVDEINFLARNVNEKVGEYNNTLGKTYAGNEFDEGIYYAGRKGRGINIYEFKDESNLVRILLHEMGHALSLGHLENPNSIMYPTNSGTTLMLSKEDLDALKAHCRIK